MAFFGTELEVIDLLRMSSRTRILSVGYDRTLMPLRTMVLRSSGHAVEECYTTADALKLLSDSIDILLICHTIPAQERNALISSARKKREQMPIFCITSNEFSKISDHCQAISNLPAPMLEAINKAVTNSRNKV